MIKLRMTIVFLALWGVLNGWGQGFGNRELINADWYFNLGDIKYGGAEFFDHSEWRKLELPHDWSVESVASPSLASCTGYLPGGIGWYRKDLDIPKNKEGNKVYVYFEGVYNNYLLLIIPLNKIFDYFPLNIRQIIQISFNFCTFEMISTRRFVCVKIRWNNIFKSKSIFCD